MLGHVRVGSMCKILIWVGIVGCVTLILQQTNTVDQTTLYRPLSNGALERLHGTLETIFTMASKRAMIGSDFCL